MHSTDQKQPVFHLEKKINQWYFSMWTGVWNVEIKTNNDNNKVLRCVFKTTDLRVDQTETTCKTCKVYVIRYKLLREEPAMKCFTKVLKPWSNKHISIKQNTTKPTTIPQKPVWIDLFQVFCKGILWVWIYIGSFLDNSDNQKRTFNS